MIIQVGEIYMDRITNQRTLYTNKTRKYLLPCLNEYGKIFANRFNNVFKVAIGIGDIVVSNRGLSYEKHLFVLLESTIAPKFFVEFLEWIKKQPMYQDDYVFNNIQKTTQHMIVIKLPEKFYDTLDTFKLGDYSKMYKKGEIDRFFHNEPQTKKVLIKDHDYRVIFVGKLNEKWKTTISPKDYEGELDFKPDQKEIFNHNLKNKD